MIGSLKVTINGEATVPTGVVRGFGPEIATWVTVMRTETLAEAELLMLFGLY